MTKRPFMKRRRRRSSTHIRPFSVTGGEGGWKTRWISGKGPGGNGGGVRTDCCQDPPRPPSSEAANESVSPLPREGLRKRCGGGHRGWKRRARASLAFGNEIRHPLLFWPCSLLVLKKGNRLVPPILGKFILFDFSFPHQFLLL